MLMKTAAVELRRLNANLTVTCLHPGTTDTRLSRTFQARAPRGELFSPGFVAERLLSVLGQGPPGEGAGFLDWAGEPIPWQPHHRRKSSVDARSCTNPQDP